MEVRRNRGIKSSFSSKDWKVIKKKLIKKIKSDWIG
jgi:hypothetical protein